MGNRDRYLSFIDVEEATLEVSLHGRFVLEGACTIYLSHSHLLTGISCFLVVFTQPNLSKWRYTS